MRLLLVSCVIPPEPVVSARLSHDLSEELSRELRVTIGAYSTISQYSHLCSSSHDYTKPNMPQTFAEIIIEDQAWICADAFIAPGVTVGQGAVVGSRAAVFKDVEPWTVVGGNPAKFIKKWKLPEGTK